jgi:hypothetical protein
MRKPFAELFEIMEARRRQVEAGEVPPASRFEPGRQMGRWARGCPDAETLCGWVDGQLRRKSPQRWLAVWQHVHIRRCQACQEEIGTLAHAIRPSREVTPHEPFRPAGLGLALRRLRGAWQLKSPLAWASCGLLVVVTLSLWSLDNQKPLEIVGEPLEPALMEETRELTWVHSESATSSVTEQAENTTIWGD